MTAEYRKTPTGVETTDGYRADSVRSLRAMLADIYGLPQVRVILYPAGR